MNTELEQAITSAAEKYRKEAGKPNAAKNGRNPVFPYVPLIMHPPVFASGSPRREQVLGRAYVTRQEAITEAQRVIDARVAHFRRQLGEPRHRALREQWGLPREI